MRTCPHPIGSEPSPSRVCANPMQSTRRVRMRGTYERSQRDCRSAFRYNAPLIRRPKTRSEALDLSSLSYDSWFHEPRIRITKCSTQGTVQAPCNPCYMSRPPQLCRVHCRGDYQSSAFLQLGREPQRPTIVNSSRKRSSHSHVFI